jgi:hypothetical protein
MTRATLMGTVLAALLAAQVALQTDTAFDGRSPDGASMSMVLETLAQPVRHLVKPPAR